MSLSEAERERIIDGMVMRRLAIDPAYRHAENADQQAEREAEIEAECVAEVERLYPS